MKLPRIGFVVHVMQVAGAEILVAATIRRLRGVIEPTVFCLDSIGPLGEQLIAEGIEVICLDRKPGRDYRVSWRLARAVAQRGIQVLHAHQYTPFFYSALARLLGLGWPRIILTEHGRHYPDIASPIRRAVNRLLLDRLSDEVNACCAFSARGLNKVDGFAAGRMQIIENGIDQSQYAGVVDRTALRQSLGLDSARRYIAVIARLHPVKDHATLLRGFAQVAPERSDVDLLVVGDGPLRGELEKLTADLKIGQRTRFLGIRRDVPALLQAVDLFALTSVSEAASLTLLEAMAAGRAVVVTAVGGNPEIVRASIDGLLVPRGDAAATAAALGQLLDDPAQAAAMGQAGRLRVQERYRLERTIGAYYTLYQRVLGRRRVERQ